MNDKKIEEKAKTPEQKAHEAYDFNSSLPKKYQIEANFWIDWFVKGYDRAIADRHDTLTQYKEALREIWSDIHFADISKDEISERIGKLIQAKQLLNNE